MKRIYLLSMLFILASGYSFAQTDLELECGFKTPPNSAKPRTWMHAMSGNMTKDGLTKDLESLCDVGIGGVLLFNITQGIPNGPIVYNGDKHHQMLRHAAVECERLGLSFGVHNCDGWSSSGGPWIKPEESMKMVVWSKTVVDGAAKVAVKLPEPTIRQGFYEDIAVIAYPSLVGELDDARSKPVITSSDESFDVNLVSDKKNDASTRLNKKGEKPSWVMFDYGEPRTLRSVYVAHHDRDVTLELSWSNDGLLFTKIKNLHATRPGKSEWCHVDNFDAVTARYFRLESDNSMSIQEIDLSSVDRIPDYISRSGVSRTFDAELVPIGDVDESMIVNSEYIINVTDKMNSDGSISVELPEGCWTIVRFGQTSTGAFNHPASEQGRGLECDKFSKKAFKKHYDSFVKRVVDNIRDVAPNAFQYVEIDSYEMGGQNWTDNFPRIFLDAKGYDIIKFLPLFAGVFVNSKDVTEAVLWDLRKLQCDLMTENYFGYFTELCHQDGVKSYIEPYGNGPVNSIDVGGKADMVMGEFWMNRESWGMVKSAVFPANVYGKNIVSAESFTSSSEINWTGHPGMAKVSGDKAWINGVNEFMFHRFTHQPNTHVKPGMTMNRWGFHFDRTQTWWDSSGKDWFKYMARGSYLLRQGVPVSDLLVFVGDGAPASVYTSALIDGVKHDCVNSDVIINRISVLNKTLVLPEGTSYKALVLKNTDNIKPETLRKIKEFAQFGITIVGERPKRVGGHNIDKSLVGEFDSLVDYIFSQPTTISLAGGMSVDKLSIVHDVAINGKPTLDFIHRRVCESDTDIYFITNTDSIATDCIYTFRVDGKIPEFWYPIDGNIVRAGEFRNKEQTTEVRVNLDANESVFVVFRKKSDGLVAVDRGDGSGGYRFDINNSLTFTASQNGTFVANLSDGRAVRTIVDDIPQNISVSGAWRVEFLKEHEYSATHQFKTLSDWKDNTNDSVKYYSGTAVYRTIVNMPQSVMAEGLSQKIDLGDVRVSAEIFVNGEYAGISWIWPYVTDISDKLKIGKNDLEIRVTNQWSNRLIGDERYPVQNGGYKLEGQFPKGLMPEWFVNNENMPSGPRTTFCTGQFYKSTDTLKPSGLLGPVTIKFEKNIKIN